MVPASFFSPFPAMLIYLWLLVWLSECFTVNKGSKYYLQLKPFYLHIHKFLVNDSFPDSYCDDFFELE